VNVVLAALVIVGASSTVQREGLQCIGVDPVVRPDGEDVGLPWPVAGVPLSVAVPLPLSTKVTGRQCAGLGERDGRRERGPVVTVKDPAVPTVKVAAQRSRWRAPGRR